MKFKEWFLIESFDELKTWMANNRISDLSQYLQQLIQKKPDASGGNNNFWYIPNSNFGVRVPRSGGNFGTFTKTQDAFPNDNFGQVIATIGNIEIVKMQTGSPAGMPHRWWKQDEKTQAGFRPQYKEKILTAAKFPQSAFDDICRKLLTLAQGGYQIDPSKPGNLLIDPTKGFNFVDVSPGQRQPRASDIANMLTGGGNAFEKNLGQDEEAKQALGTILQKLQVASQNTGVFYGADSLQYLAQLAQSLPT